MKRIVISCIFCILYSWSMVMPMESFNNNKHDHDVTAGKIVVARTRQYATLGSIASGFTFFAATATRHMHWPYWAKRTPLFCFVSCNALAQLPTITGIEHDPQKMTFVGNMYTRIKRT